MSYILDVGRLPKISTLGMNGGHMRGINASNTGPLFLETAQKE